MTVTVMYMTCPVIGRKYEKSGFVIKTDTEGRLTTDHTNVTFRQ